MCITFSSGTTEDIEQEENYLKEYNGSKVRDGQADLLPLYSGNTSYRKSGTCLLIILLIPLLAINTRSNLRHEA
jgi:hypothetical protein